MSAQIKPGAYYVGQAIDLSVGVVAGRERPEVSTPKVAGAEVQFVRHDPLRPVSAAGSATSCSSGTCSGPGIG